MFFSFLIAIGVRWVHDAKVKGHRRRRNSRKGVVVKSSTSYRKNQKCENHEHMPQVQGADACTSAAYLQAKRIEYLKGFVLEKNAVRLVVR